MKWCQDQRIPWDYTYRSPIFYLLAHDQLQTNRVMPIKPKNTRNSQQCNIDVVTKTQGGTIGNERANSLAKKGAYWSQYWSHPKSDYKRAETAQAHKMEPTNEMKT